MSEVLGLSIKTFQKVSEGCACQRGFKWVSTFFMVYQEVSGTSFLWTQGVLMGCSVNLRMIHVIQKEVSGV